MSINDIKTEAIHLRLKGFTYAEIQQSLGKRISKSTLSSWCSNIQMTQEYEKKIKIKNLRHLTIIRKLAWATNLKKRQSYLKELLNKNIHLTTNIDKNIQKLLLSILYAAEGSKYSGTKFLSLSNSNPNIIKFFLTTLKNCYSIDENKLRVRIQGRYDQNPEILKKYWEKITQIDSKLFYPLYIDKRTKGKVTTKNNYYGVCSIIYFSTGIQLELELLGNAIIQQVNRAGGAIG